MPFVGDFPEFGHTLKQDGALIFFKIKKKLDI